MKIKIQMLLLCKKAKRDKEKIIIKQKQNITENNKAGGCGIINDQMIEQIEKINSGSKGNRYFKTAGDGT